LVEKLLPMGWLACVLPILKRSPIAIEVYVLCCFGIALALSAAVWFLYERVAAVRWFVYILAGLRGLEIIVRTANVDIKTVVDPIRTLVLAAINYVELMLWFGLVYALNYHCLHDFSIITQLTIGYGDVYAMGWLRIIAAGQGLIGALFVIVILGRAVSASPTPSEPEPPNTPHAG
jgi:Ion channel